MDWQELVALALVGAAAVGLFCARLRRSRNRLATGCGCGCGYAGGSTRPPSIVLQGRKGERPRLVVSAR